MATETIAFHKAVPILDSFGGDRDIVRNLAASERSAFNTTLPSPNGVKGIYIGGTATYDLYVELADANMIVPFLSIPGGVFYRMNVTRIINDDTHETTAPNILVLY